MPDSSWSAVVVVAPTASITSDFLQTQKEKKERKERIVTHQAWSHVSLQMINVAFSSTYFPAIAAFRSDLSEDEQEERVAAHFQLGSIRSAQQPLWCWQLICPFKSIDHKEQRKWAPFPRTWAGKTSSRMKGRRKPQQQFKYWPV